MIRKVTRQKASHQVLAQLKAGINDGTFPVGEKLPSENVLADAFGVSRAGARRSACWRSAASSPHAGRRPPGGTAFAAEQIRTAGDGGSRPPRGSAAGNARSHGTTGGAHGRRAPHRTGVAGDRTGAPRLS
ncbi:GntR family transcriptional regulator [Serratia ureilytica]